MDETFRIGQAASMVDVKPYVLRFWESEFSGLNPIRTDSGQRLYTREHLDLVRRIKGLLYDKGMTIEGARRALEAEEALAGPVARDRPEDPEAAKQRVLSEVADELRSIRGLLSREG
jgi:DNA-binding transcriptional MerR regulator